MASKPIQVVGAVIFDGKNKRIFVGQRSKYAKHPLKWEFIGGKIQDGEDFFKATEREFFEETKLKITAKKVVGKANFNYGGDIGEVEVYFVECKKFSGKPKIDKNVYEKVEWIERKNLPKLDWIAADKEFANKLVG